MKKLFIWSISIILPFFSASQSGPAGIGNSANNELWLVAEGNSYIDAGVTPGGNNASIQQWTDISGNNNHAVHITTSLQPLLKTNEVNGFATLRFDGSNDRLLASGISTSNQLTLFVVVKHIGFTNINDGIVHAAPTGQAFSTDGDSKVVGMWTQVSDGRIWGRGVQSDGTIQSISKVSTLSTGQFYVITQDYDGSDINQYVNGSLAGAASYDGTLDSWTDFGVGRQGSETLNGDLAEIIVYTNHLNTAQRYIIQNYLAAKYNIGLSANDIYNEDEAGANNYDYEVAGIGRVDASNIQNDSQGSGAVRILNPSDLDNDEFLFWGHNNGDFEASNLSDVPGDVQARLDRVWRVSERNAANSASVDVGTVDLQWDLAGLEPVFTDDLRLIIDTDNDGLFSDETAISGATSLGGSIYQFANVPGGASGISDNRRFTLGTTDLSGTPLPIQLANFDAYPLNQSVAIQWATLTETNNSFFSIERSTNGEIWELVTKIVGAVNSNQLINYTFTDETPHPGISYYRLKQTDFDGQFTFSPIRSVNVDKFTNPNIRHYPNPVENNVTLEGNKAALSSISMYDALGKNISSLTTIVRHHNNKVTINLSRIDKGIYYVKTKTNTIKVFKK